VLDDHGQADAEHGPKQRSHDDQELAELAKRAIHKASNIERTLSGLPTARTIKPDQARPNLAARSFYRAGCDPRSLACGVTFDRSRSLLDSKEAVGALSALTPKGLWPTWRLETEGWDRSIEGKRPSLAGKLQWAQRGGACRRGWRTPRGRAW
jgi:hypothetical protein